MAGLHVKFDVIGGDSPAVNIRTDLQKEHLASALIKRVAASQSVSVPNARGTGVHTVLTSKIVGVKVTDVAENRTTATLDDIIFE
ncbi:MULTISPECIES: hypothetical protein [Bacillales]|uniref:hypothetical protein n=1 Tax=Bacillales TaxID=1385 RepID=UPI000BEDB4B9|nr:hypothetical protein [Bacillus cereus]PED33866.1 hypothetical protein CON13_01440 [Bacillus cereus]PEE52047.1 hypothetical protein COM80_16510 [Bacillus cereus]PFL90893.1 hypothetical protein COJ35_24185 [Bacillus cereus]PFV69476.1 hypothetical protein COL16_18540 [Bacillus cereus]PGS34936.1 hypothetical protein COC56_16465 [Bacillus cereus]